MAFIGKRTVLSQTGRPRCLQNRRYFGFRNGEPASGGSLMDTMAPVVIAGLGNGGFGRRRWPDPRARRSPIPGKRAAADIPTSSGRHSCAIWCDEIYSGRMVRRAFHGQWRDWLVRP